jgi:PAS domain S-box-containing protein
MRVLIVDDSEQNLYMLQVLLEGNGYRVETAANGAEALEKARRDPPALIITDILMPVMDGFTLCREWQQDERLKEIPFVFYTATYTDPKDQELALSLGAERFIVKPMEPDVFVDIVQQVIREAKEGRLRTPGTPVGEEPVYLKTYNDRLVKKLEHKMLQLERANRRLAALYGASAELSSLQPLDEMIPRVLLAVVEAMAFVNGIYYTYNEAGQTFHLQEAIGFPPEMLNDFRQRLVFHMGEERGLVGLVGQTRRPLIVADAQHDPRWAVIDGAVRSALFVPVVHQERVLGVVSFLSAAANFDDADVRNATILTNNLSIAIENARLVEGLRQSEARFRRLAENAQDLIYRYRLLPTPGFEYVSPAATVITGYTPEEHYADPDLGLKLVHPDDRSVLEAHFRGEGTFDESLTLRWVRKDGTVIWAEQRNVPIYDEAGILVALEGIARDVTERRRSEQALRESEAKFRTLAETAPAAIFIYQDTGFRYVNPAAEALTGYAATELLAMNFWDVVHPDFRDVVRARGLARQKGEQVSPGYEFKILARSGEERWLDFTAGRIEFEGQSAAIGTAYDITERKRAQEEVHRLSQFRESVIENANVWLNVLDEQANVVIWNKAAEEISGYTREEVVGHGKVWEWLYPEETYRSEITSKAAAIIEKSEAVEDFETTIRRKDGKERVISWYSQNLVDVAGGPIGSIALGRNVTRRKQVEEALWQHAERLKTLREIDQAILAARSPEDIAQAALGRIRQLVDCQGGGVARFDAENQEAILFAVYSEGALTIEAGTHLPLEGIVEIEALRQGEVLVEEDLLAIADPPTAIQALRAADVRSYVAVPLLAQGNLIGALALGSESPGAFPPESVAITREVADQVAVALHQADLRAALESEQRKLETLVEHLPEGILLLDGSGRILLANPAARTCLPLLTAIEHPATGRAGEVLTHLAGRSLDELLNPPLEGPWHELEVSGPPQRFFQAAARPVRLAADSVGWALVIQDVTEQRQAQERIQQQERLAAVGQLAGGIAHDFNNLLSAIMLYAQIPLNKPGLPPEAAQSLEIIAGESRRAAELVQQILDFSRRSTIETRPVDLKPFVEEAMRMLERTIPENISLVLRVQLGEYMVRADPTRIQQVLMNLVVNARDAMPGGGVLRIELASLEVSLEEQPPVAEMEPGQWICLSVSDTGEGIPPQVLPHIFEPFFTTKPRGEGAGLGLAQVHGIVTQHGGYCDVGTKMGEGATFYVYLPAYHAAEEAAREGEVGTTPEGKGETILLVEDNEQLREAAQRILESLGYRVLAAANGREALERYETTEGIDLVLTDVVMPEMGAADLARALGNIDPSAKVLAISGYVAAEELQAVKAAGIPDVIPKPLDADVLAKAIRRALDAERNRWIES